MEDSQVLTEDILKKLGFKRVERKGYGASTRIFRIEPPKREDISNYPYFIEFLLKEHLPAENSNCGILGVYSPEQEAYMIPGDLRKKKDPWTEEDHERARNHKEMVEEYCSYVAWGVKTVGRLKELYKALTCRELEETEEHGTFILEA